MTRIVRLACTASAAALAVGLGLAAVPAYAQGAATTQSATRSFDIPAQPLDEALSAFARAADVQLAYSAELVAGRSSPGVSGSHTVQDALARLLAGSGLTFRMTDARTFTLTALTPADGEKVTGAVQVEGAQGSPYFGGAGVAAGVNGVNGSRDITATEGTGSFTSGALTIGSKVPQALKDVPQSISLLTSERLEQQNVTDFTSAMRQLPGITLVQGTTSLDNTFYSRGFAIRSIQVDGGAPLSTGLASDKAFFPQIDMSVYDHVELLRGAAGLFNAYGDPSGTVNLVRKRPLDHGQVSIDAQVGSWSNYRISADATSPLALDGRLRGRLVMTYQDNHHFYDIAKDNKTLIYGIADLDLTPNTLVSAGGSYTRQDSLPWSSGLPRSQNGDDLMLPRSTCLCFDWNSWDFDTTEIFGNVEQKLGGEWVAKLNLTWNRQESRQKVGYSQGGVNPDTGAGPRLYGTFSDAFSKQFSAEATLAGAFEIFGQRQEITLGVNRVRSDASGMHSYATLITSSATTPYQPYPGGPLYCNDIGTCPSGFASPPIDVYDFDPYDPIYTEPRNPLVSSRNPVNVQTQTSAYLNLRLTAFDRWHLTTGVRWSRYEYKQSTEYLCTSIPASDPGYSGSCYGLQIGDISSAYSTDYGANDISWPPAVNLSYDITKSLTAYVGYTDIYRSQASQLGGDLKPIAPITGSNWEVGAKWAPNGGRLNLSIAAYRINQKGFATDDSADRYDFDHYDYDAGIYYYIIADDGTPIPNGEVSPGVYCCSVNRPDATYRSQGFDLEIAGEVMTGWQVSASYTYDDAVYHGVSFGDYNGQSFLSIQPKNLFKLWTSYDFGAAGSQGPLSGLVVSAGLNGQSSAYYEGNACKDDFIVVSSTTGVSSCPGKFIDDEYVDGYYVYNYTVPSYVLVSARVDYRFSDKWSLAINLENILDKTYYQTTGSSPTSGHWYGAPRSFTATLRAKW